MLLVKICGAGSASRELWVVQNRDIELLCECFQQGLLGNQAKSDENRAESFMVATLALLLACQRIGQGRLRQAGASDQALAEKVRRVERVGVVQGIGIHWHRGKTQVKNVSAIMKKSWTACAAQDLVPDCNNRVLRRLLAVDGVLHHLDADRVVQRGQVARVAAFGDGLDGAAQYLAGAGLR